MTSRTDLPENAIAEALAPTESLPLFGHAYDWPTELVVFWNKLTGPSRQHWQRSSFIPSQYRMGAIVPQVRIAFLGDVLPECRRAYRIGEGVQQFLEGVDYLALNLEGVVCDRRGVVNAVRHNRRIFDFLAELFPSERTVLLCANNHAADCGRQALEQSCRELRERGFLLAGTVATPSVLLPEGIQLSNGTEWLNVRRPYVPRLFEAAAAQSDSAKFRIFCPHWGTEMTLFPSPRQIERARRLLSQWDLIVGHHPHCPQPIAELDGKLVAYSLGNFARGDGGERGWHGVALRVTLGTDAGGKWRLGESRWSFISQTPNSSDALLIETAERCRFFPDVTGSAV